VTALLHAARAPLLRLCGCGASTSGVGSGATRTSLHEGALRLLYGCLSLNDGVRGAATHALVSHVLSVPMLADAVPVQKMPLAAPPQWTAFVAQLRLPLSFAASADEWRSDVWFLGNFLSWLPPPRELSMDAVTACVAVLAQLVETLPDEAYLLAVPVVQTRIGSRYSAAEMPASLVSQVRGVEGGGTCRRAARVCDALRMCACSFVQLGRLCSESFIRDWARRCFDARPELLRNKRLRLRDDEGDPLEAVRACCTLRCGVCIGRACSTLSVCVCVVRPNRHSSCRAQHRGIEEHAHKAVGVLQARHPVLFVEVGW
jgi:hypothetical protein